MGKIKALKYDVELDSDEITHALWQAANAGHIPA